MSLFSATLGSDFNCALQECDCYYEKNAFERNILLLNDKTVIFRKGFPTIPQCGPTRQEYYSECKHKGPKMKALKNRTDVVRT